MTRTILKIVTVFVIGTVGGIFADQILWPYFVERPLFYKYDLEQRPIQITKQQKITIQENQALQDAIEEVKTSVVAVRSETGFGSGLVASSDGLVVTLNSVANGTSTVVYQGQQLKAGLVKTEGKFTVLRINKDNLPTPAFIDIEQARLGQRVFLIGKLFKEKELVTVINHGIIKYFDKNGIHTNIFEIKTLGGSPLLDIKGDVLGLVTIDRQGKVTSIPLPPTDQLFKP